jgi:hypothetical protein
MTGWKKYWPGLLVLTSITPFLFWSVSAERAGARRFGPGEFKEVMAIAQKLGLHYRGEHEDETVQQRLLVSETPLSWERANGLFIGSRMTADWKGTVAVFRSDREISLLPQQMTIWGQFLLYGDPALIKRLTSQSDL